jgi:hypothetical protein
VYRGIRSALPPAPPQCDRDHDEQDHADRAAHDAVAGDGEEREPGEESRDHGGCEPQQRRPVGVATVGDECEDVADDEQQEHRGGRGASGQHGREQRDRQDAAAGQRRLRDADRHRGERERGPRPRLEGDHRRSASSSATIAS